MTARHRKSDDLIETVPANVRTEAAAIMRVAATIGQEAVIVLPLVQAVLETAVTTTRGEYRHSYLLNSVYRS